jgi:hypothetical protein
VTSCTSRVTLGLKSQMLASRSKTLGLSRPPDHATRATCHTIASIMSICRWVTSRVTRVTSWASRGQRSGGKARSPRSRPAKVSLVERPPLSSVQASGICLPLARVSTSIWWDFSPMEVRASHFPICTCPLGMVLQQQQLRRPWDHK